MNHTPLRHRLLLGCEPSPEQLVLYEPFPEKRGYALTAPDPVLFEAAFILALTQTFEREGTLHKVFFFVTPELKNAWVNEQMTLIARKIFAQCKSYPNAAKRARHLDSLFRHVLIGRDIPEKVPEQFWVAFGIDPQVAPLWLRNALL